MQNGRNPRTPMARDRREKAASLRLGSYVFKKKGISRFDLRDPYHLAVALSWPQFLATLLAIYLLVNIVFATLFWLVPGSVANARPDSFADAFFFQHRDAGDGRLWRDVPGDVLRPCGRVGRDRIRARVHRHSDRPHLRPLLAAAGQVGLRRQSRGGDAQRQ